MPDTIDLLATVFTKTALGQAEISSRALGLSLLVRRALLLVDGRRSGAELSVFLVGKGDIEVVLAELLDKGCIEPTGRASVLADPKPRVETPAMPALAEVGELAGLPPPEARSAKDNDMARNFMINSVNAIIGQQMRISLIHDIFHAEGTQGLRRVYQAWSASMADHHMGARRLPELREKLFKVL